MFNPTAYLTAIKQVTARATQQPLDNMTNETHVTTMMEPTEASDYPEDGMFIHGLFMEGGRWNRQEGRLDESEPKKLCAQDALHYLFRSNLHFFLSTELQTGRTTRVISAVLHRYFREIFINFLLRL